VLPERHPWQEHVALHVGLRTGYCGSLTTFSAWLLQCVQLLVGGSGRDGGQWAQVLHSRQRPSIFLVGLCRLYSSGSHRQYAFQPSSMCKRHLTS